MKHITVTLTSSVSSALETEIMFSVASARAQGIEFLKLEIPSEDDGRVTPAVAKILRLLKKQGRIQLFIDAEGLYGSSTEAQYLANKHPDLTDICEKSEKAFIIKI